MSKIFFLLCIFYFVSINANELKSLKESFNNIENEGDKSLLLMQRCAAIYGALSVMPPIEMNPEELKTRYKIFLQSAVNQEMIIKKYLMKNNPIKINWKFLNHQLYYLYKFLNKIIKKIILFFKIHG